MRKCSLFFLLLFSSFYSFHIEAAKPNFIDISQFRTTVDNYYLGIFEEDAWKLGNYAFNYAPELMPFFAQLKRDHSIQAAIETGTYLGSTTVVLSLLYDQVHTIEINESQYQVSKERLRQFGNIHCHLGSSEQVLAKILPLLKNERILFYLDAHWGAHWPLLDELEEISKTHRDNCIIVIDDIKVPGRPDIAYDVYGTLECSYEYVAAQLNNVFTSYTIHYLIPRSPKCRGKLIVIPDHWKQENSSLMGS